MRSFQFLIGLLLVLVGVYVLGQNIIFTTQVGGYWWRHLSATGTVLAMAAGVVSLTWFGRSGQTTGWTLIGVGIVLAIASGGMVIRPTSLWQLFVALVALTGGFRLMQGRRIRF